MKRSKLLAMPPDAKADLHLEHRANFHDARRRQADAHGHIAKLLANRRIEKASREYHDSLENFGMIEGVRREIERADAASHEVPAEPVTDANTKILEALSIPEL